MGSLQSIEARQRANRDFLSTPSCARGRPKAPRLADLLSATASRGQVACPARETGLNLSSEPSNRESRRGRTKQCAHPWNLRRLAYRAGLETYPVIIGGIPVRPR